MFRQVLAPPHNNKLVFVHKSARGSGADTALMQAPIRLAAGLDSETGHPSYYKKARLLWWLPDDLTGLVPTDTEISICLDPIFDSRH